VFLTPEIFTNPDINPNSELQSARTANPRASTGALRFMLA
jgi:hypothetical protein